MRVRVKVRVRVRVWVRKEVPNLLTAVAKIQF